MSNQIELIEKLYAKTKTYKIPKEPKEGKKQLSVEITPLSLEDIGLFSMEEDISSSENAKRARKIISKSLGVDENIIAKISFEFMNDLLDAIKDANNFKEEDLKKTGIKDFIQKKQEQMKAKKEEENAESNRPA